MGALVFGTNVVAGRVWTKEGIYDLESFTVVGPSITRMTPKILRSSAVSTERYDRQSRMFGERGRKFSPASRLLLLV